MVGVCDPLCHHPTEINVVKKGTKKRNYEIDHGFVAFYDSFLSLALYIDDPIELAVALLATVLFCVVEYTKDLLIFYLEIVWQRY